MWIPQGKIDGVDPDWLPIDESETELRALREVTPGHPTWRDPEMLRALREKIGMPQGKNTTPAEDDRMRQTSPRGRRLSDPDMEFLDGAEGAEKWKQNHEL